MKLRFLEKNIHMREIIKGASTAFLQKGIGALLAFTMNFLLARELGPSGLGLYYQAITVVAMACTFSNMGVGSALLKYVSIATASKNYYQLSGLYRKGILVVFPACIVCFVIVYISSNWLAERLFHEKELGKILRIAAFAIPPLTLATIHAQLLQAIKRVGFSLFIQASCVPVVMIVLLVFFFNEVKAPTVVIFYLLSTIFSLVAGVFLWCYFMPMVWKIRGFFSAKTLFSTSIPLLMVSSSYLINSWTDTMMLGIYHQAKDVGIYNIALRTANLVNFILVAFVSILSPKIAVLWSEGKVQELKKMTVASSRIMLLIATPIFIIFLFFPNKIINIFGDDFAGGSYILIYLAIGQIVNVAVGPVGQLLAMTGNQNILRNIMISSSLGNIFLNILLVPKYGPEGAAVATLSTTVISNVASLFCVRKKLRFFSFAFATTR